MDSNELADLRREYSREQLTETSVATDPLEQFDKWMKEALRSEIIDATAMTLATADAQGLPSARVVLLKGFDQRGFRFFTNYESRKAQDLAENPRAVLHFFWAELERQINVSGRVEKISAEESEAYFKSRPVESRLGAWASKQSSVVASRDELEERFEELRAQYDGQDIPLPPFWGGYRLVPNRFEFWQGRASRLHDRICYELGDGRWEIYRLSP